MKKRTSALIIALLVQGVSIGLVVTIAVSYNSNQTKKELERVKLFSSRSQRLKIF